MAKKKQVEVEIPQMEQSVVETPIIKEKPQPKKTSPEDNWEIKNRTYFIKGKARKSLSRSIKSSGIYYFDEEKGYERELKYCENQKTPFVD